LDSFSSGSFKLGRWSRPRSMGFGGWSPRILPRRVRCRIFSGTSGVDLRSPVSHRLRWSFSESCSIHPGKTPKVREAAFTGNRGDTSSRP